MVFIEEKKLTINQEFKHVNDSFPVHNKQWNKYIFDFDPEQ